MKRLSLPVRTLESALLPPRSPSVRRSYSIAVCANQTRLSSRSSQSKSGRLRLHYSLPRQREVVANWSRMGLSTGHAYLLNAFSMKVIFYINIERALLLGPGATLLKTRTNSKPQTANRQPHT